MHCSDEQLLAHLDGELSIFSRLRVGRHLRSCWHCRTRLGACEQEIQKLTVAVDEWPFPAPEWSREAGQRLNRHLQVIERSIAESPGRRSRRVAVPVFAAAVAAMLCLSGWFLWRGSLVQLRPAEVIAQVSRVEQTIYVQPVEQTFTVEIAQIRPVRQTVNAKLQIWFDRASGRFASRLSGPGGAVRHALWRPSSDTEFVYSPASSPEVQQQRPHREKAIPLESLADYGLNPSELERAFLHWLESRSWNPISFSPDISSWAAEDGSIASAERIRADNGTPMIRITARHRSQTMVAVLTVEVDSSSYMPRLQTIRFETPERAVEFRLAATSIQPIRHTEMTANMFRPDSVAAAEVRLPRPSLPKPEAPANPPAAASPADVPAMDPHAVEARFLLHQAGACLGEPVRVSEEPGGTRVDHIGPEPRSYRCELGLGYMLSALSDLRRDQPARDDGPRAVAIRHAWAMRRMAEDFPERSISGLPPASWQMLETMLRDHTAGVRSELARLGLPSSPGSPARTGNPDWRTSVVRLFELLSADSSAKEPDLFGETMNRRLDEILHGFSVESNRRGR